jgi:hypothetical protein
MGKNSRLPNKLQRAVSEGNFSSTFLGKAPASGFAQKPNQKVFCPKSI